MRAAIRARPQEKADRQEQADGEVQSLVVRVQERGGQTIEGEPLGKPEEL
jgi:hypothetical protein